MNNMPNFHLSKFIIVVLFITNISSAQYDDENPTIKQYELDYNYREFPIIKDSVKNPGIYRNFEEFRANRPSAKLAGVIVGVDTKYRSSIFNDPFFFKSYKIDVSKEIARDVGSVFGFCDGHTIYITRGAQDSCRINDASFYELNYIGRFCVYDTINFSASMSTLPNMPAMMSYVPEKGVTIIEMTTGESKVLNNGRLKKILADNKVLLERFKSEEHKSEHLKEYLIDYLREREK